MKKNLLAGIFAILSFSVSAELIQHTDQIAEIKFSGTMYQLGYHVGSEAKEQILEAIDKFDKTLDVMLPGLGVAPLGKAMDPEVTKLEKYSPGTYQYIKGLSEALNMPMGFLLAVGMSDEAILESQANGGMGFLQVSAPAKCTVIGASDGEGKAWGGANFDYMAINYSGLIVLNYTDELGRTRVIQTWAGLIPYGGITSGGQALLMNTMADEGTKREKAGGEILAEQSVPSYYLSWDAYKATSAEELLALMQQHQQYTAFFSYTLVDANSVVFNVENHYPTGVSYSYDSVKGHANHSVYQLKDFVDSSFAAHSLERQAAVDSFAKLANANTSQAEVFKLLRSKPLWKGRGPMMGTVSSTHFAIDGKQVTMTIKTDERHAPVIIHNH